MKYSLEESLQKLKHELDTSAKNEPENQKNNVVQLALEKEKPREKNIEAWTVAEVKEWFIKNSLSLSIFEHFTPCSGIILKQIYDMKKTAPEFFYQSIKEVKDIQINELFLFARFIEEAFEKQL